MARQGSELILAGDVGATKTYLGLFRFPGNRLVSVLEDVFPSRDYSNLSSLLEEFASRHKPPVRTACFGIAGTQTDDRWEMANLPWTIEARALAPVLGTKRILLLNDIEALGYGLAQLEPEKLAVLQAGRPQPAANAALIAAGTGLGEGILFWDGRQHQPRASEGGHADFAPRTALEAEFFLYACERLGRVCYDRVVSGPGLYLLYQFLRDTGKAEEPTWLAEKIQREAPVPVIVETALAGKAILCVQALEMFVALYGAEAGNLALKALARAGVYIGGGIAPRILSKLRERAFLDAFRHKGRLSPLMAEIPIRVILEPKTALYGAAHYAVQRESP